MKLRKYRVREFRSIWDSGDIDIGQQTCLVGKNEAGKTALLHALYKTNPIIEDDAGFDPTFEYPKREVEDYRLAVEQGQRESVVVVESEYEFDDEDQMAVSEIVGPHALGADSMTVYHYYDDEPDVSLDVDDRAAMEYLAESADLSGDMAEELKGADDWKDYLEIVETDSWDDDLLSVVREIAELGLLVYISQKILGPRMPKFMYFDEYYQMKGEENLDALVARERSEELEDRDRPLLGLIHLARLDLDELQNAESTQALKNKLEGAGNYLTRRIAEYWSQNRHIQMRFDVREGRAGDPDGMQAGLNLWGEIYDSVHWSTTPLSARSRGFLWFFSFLAWYEHVKSEGHDVILLLDEPGLSLHGRAQGDLLRFFETELTPYHQLMYTTHSPFMVDPQRFECVRIVQDLGIDTDKELPRKKDGTKVLTDVFDATDESLFPLHGALGFDIHQTLFVGPNSLVVEGVSDLLYLTTMSDGLTREGRTGLSDRWVVTPVGSIGKVSTFVSLLGSQRGMNIAVLLDIAPDSRELVQALYRKKLLLKKKVRTYADFLPGDDRSADVEDMFERAFYIELVNREFTRELEDAKISQDDLNAETPRVVKALQGYFVTHPMKSGSFSHYRPARYFSEHAVELWSHLSEGTKNQFEELFKEMNGLLKSRR